MKRISPKKIDQIHEQLVLNKGLTGWKNEKKETNKLRKETALSIQEPKTESKSLLSLSDKLFGQCFPSLQRKIIVKNPYHKLQYRSLDKNDKKTKQNYVLQQTSKNENRGQGLNDNQSALKVNFAYKHSLPSTLASEVNYKNQEFLFPGNVSQTNFSSYYYDSRALSKDDNLKNKQNQNVKLFLSENLNTQIPSLRLRVKDERSRKTSTQRKFSEHISNNLFSAVHWKKQSDSYQSCNKIWNGQSALDSYKTKQNLQNSRSQKITHLEQMPSKLCESIRINKWQQQKNLEDPQKSQILDGMNDSPLEKLDLFERSTKPKHSKIKNFLRSKDDQIQVKQNPRFSCSQPQDYKDKTQLDSQNEEQSIQLYNFDYKINKNRFKSLEQCGCTIVSKYNRSSQKKSVLQQSNIIYQASKMVQGQKINQSKLPAFSDSQIIFNQQKKNSQNNKTYSSFIHQLNFQNKSVVISRKSNDNIFINKKTKNKFIRSKQKPASLMNQIKCETEQMEIRFDIDTFIEYGPI